MASGAAARDQVADLLAPVLAQSGLDLESVDLTPAGRRTVLRIVVDADGGVTLDQLADTSRTVAKLLDSGDVMGAGAYTLEVTSRGVDRPLTEPRHWRRNVGRLVKVVHADGSQLVGRVTAAGEESADLDVDGTPHQVEFARVAKARVQVEFAKMAPADDAEPGEDLDDDTYDGHGDDDKTYDDTDKEG
ncbi:ribosome maturation factor RimP [Actinopolymorpha cephalotaxi]|uniref:Ribosome maturation factor RimP n=1 Tax=Actinopolymorpha cephalotaxi TaxID=504797 RepID=A0A1I2R9P9_9ACTN|nr:ribosome maturation factor RimP [Actinopolymorpha cephalotaxi]NYH82301.1 ribosome maturation factor RimP [Actinopolymorpha cephalotaxi]SFG37445.1 ribosome maturation factor RimP [Actinopolymorpha cephalotaxi]